MTERRRSGHVCIRENVLVELHCARTGELLRSYWLANKITDAGFNSIIRDLLAGSGFAPTHIAVGTNGATPTAADTTLGNEVFRNTITLRIPADKRLKFQLFLDTGDANGNTLREAGIFNAGTTGDMLSHVLIEPEIPKDATVTATLTWNYTFEEG
jgi:hypothetical protein